MYSIKSIHLLLALLFSFRLIDIIDVEFRHAEITGLFNGNGYDSSYVPV